MWTFAWISAFLYSFSKFLSMKKFLYKKINYYIKILCTIFKTLQKILDLSFHLSHVSKRLIDNVYTNELKIILSECIHLYRKLKIIKDTWKKRFELRLDYTNHRKFQGLIKNLSSILHCIEKSNDFEDRYRKVEIYVIM